ncbi:Cysteine-rich RLK (RECEPTOR-like protein kinase) 8 isoform 4 [Theobroma cacao]|uniref:Cysteine-rich RLK (RECEPTOR-like protein kinase) 8 isoform 4 n=2 Tax=Theobroma cacao TaxID=3641 RepID=A0A061EPL2_THECC|nr:Cysteine-rich RLK (RECEPTOR-like protein kinase) 8 isoform 4 [Theobroma cacao]
MALSGFNTSAPSVFTSENYAIWSVKMMSYLKAFSLWEAMEIGEEPVQRHANPTLAQIRQFEEDKAKSLLSRFMQNPTQTHFAAAKRVLRYIRGTVECRLKFTRKDCHDLIGYSDNDWAEDTDDSKSTRGYCFSFGSGIFSWNSKKQEVVAQSSAEVEYIAAAAATNHAIWLRKVLQDLGFEQVKGTILFIDNKSAISIAQNPVQYGRTKHIKVKYHAIRDAIKYEKIEVKHCGTDIQLADIFTKSLGKDKFMFLRSELRICSLNTKEVC